MKITFQVCVHSAEGEFQFCVEPQRDAHMARHDGLVLSDAFGANRVFVRTLHNGKIRANETYTDFLARAR